MLMMPAMQTSLRLQLDDHCNIWCDRLIVVSYCAIIRQRKNAVGKNQLGDDAERKFLTFFYTSKLCEVVKLEESPR